MPYFSQRNNIHHQNRNPNPAKHIIGYKPKWTILINRKKGYRRNPREECESRKKSDKSFKSPTIPKYNEKKCENKRKIIHWCDAEKSLTK